MTCSIFCDEKESHSNLVKHAAYAYLDVYSLYMFSGVSNTLISHIARYFGFNKIEKIKRRKKRNQLPKCMAFFKLIGSFFQDIIGFSGEDKEYTSKSLFFWQMLSNFYIHKHTENIEAGIFNV